MSSYFSFEPQHFNNNGDQGNLLVLSKQLALSGQSFTETEEIRDADFVLVGDASIAAMRHYAGRLELLRPFIKDRFAQGAPTLIVGSSYEFFASDLGLTSKPYLRRSEFVDQDGIFGYMNVDHNLPPFVANGAFMATSLFGPILAKNPELLEQMTISLGATFQIENIEREWVAEIRRRSIGG